MYHVSTLYLILFLPYTLGKDIQTRSKDCRTLRALRVHHTARAETLVD
ncbi:hypothetical protein An04g04610 [Aspergillus niger]|uniref:Uncharacterized protein n=2 Tax=Aspergillus niger TaxID=5061 RepID=A2QIT1_ASPNC|nr:hypothetical protein An04g04610 [Aspergillus niger]CAK38725.1 hypothetical protein An04g04610 [Aspergillus niger]